MQVIEFGGQQYDFPDEATDKQMLEFLETVPAEATANTEEPQEPFREQPIIKKDEGVTKNKEGQHIAYRDSIRTKKFPKGRLTAGRGHLLIDKEPQLYPEGTVVPDEVVKRWFKDDMSKADRELTELLEERAVHVPDEVFDILHNMTFNMGKEGMRGFKDMWKAVEVSDWATVSKEMLTTTDDKGTRPSLWAKQVGNRAVRLADRMASLHTDNKQETAATE